MVLLSSLSQGGKQNIARKNIHAALLLQNMFVNKHFKQETAYSRVDHNLQVLSHCSSYTASHLINSMYH